MARFAAFLCVLALTAPGTALAQGGGAFEPIPPAPPPAPTTQPEPAGPTRPSDDGLSSTQQLLIAMSGIFVLFGIGWLIVRDARGAAPVETRGAAGGAAGDAPQPKGSRTPAGVRHRTSRAKAKAARQARKKSRRR
jgi:hypothetical protein